MGIFGEPGPVAITYIAGWRDPASSLGDPYGGFSVGWVQGGHGFGSIEFSMDAEGRICLDSELSGKDFAREVLLALVDGCTVTWREMEPRSLTTVGQRLDNLKSQYAPPEGASFVWAYRRLAETAYLAAPEAAEPLPESDDWACPAAVESRALELAAEGPVAVEGWRVSDGEFQLFPAIAAFGPDGMLP